MTNWASYAIEKLLEGKSATVTPHGNSMIGRVASGQEVLVEPGEPEVGDVVLVRCKGNIYLHLVKAQQGDRFLIGNNRGRVNGWVHRAAIFGIADV